MNKLLPVFVAAAFATVSIAASAADEVKTDAKPAAEAKHETAKKTHAAKVKSKKASAEKKSAEKPAEKK